MLTPKYLQVPFEVLVRRQIARLLDPSLQCARFIYDELVKVENSYLAFYALGALLYASLTLIK